MPLNFNNVESELGLTLSNCYTVISRYEGDMNYLTITVTMYASKEAYELGKKAVATDSITIKVSELAKTNIFAYIYDALISSALLHKYAPSVIAWPFSMTPTVTDPEVTPDPNDLTVNDGTNGSEM